MGAKAILPEIVGGDRLIRAVSVETLCLGVPVETLEIRTVSVETLVMRLGASVETLKVMLVLKETPVN